jgi:hypothetical protein
VTVGPEVFGDDDRAQRARPGADVLDVVEGRNLVETRLRRARCRALATAGTSYRHGSCMTSSRMTLVASGVAAHAVTLSFA